MSQLAPAPASAPPGAAPAPHQPSSGSSRPPNLTHGPPVLANPFAQSPLQASNTPPSKSRIYPWLKTLLRFCAALLGSGSIIVFIYYQVRADERDTRNLEYAARSWNLSVWTAHKDYCDFQLTHDNNTVAESCSIGSPPVRLAKVKRWMKANTAIWVKPGRMHVLHCTLLATGMVAILGMLYRWRLFTCSPLLTRFQRLMQRSPGRIDKSTEPASSTGPPQASSTAYERVHTVSTTPSRSSKHKSSGIGRRNLKMKSARYKGRGIEINLLHDWIDRNTPAGDQVDSQLHDSLGEERRKDVQVERVLEEFLRDTMIDLLMVDSRIAELGEIAISRLGNAVRFQESLFDLLNIYYIDLSDEFLSMSSTLGKTHEEGRTRSHEIFSVVAPCWIYEVKKSRTYIAEKVVERMTAGEGLTEPHIVRARTEYLIHRTQREWRHKHDMHQVEAQVGMVIRLLTNGTASSRLKEEFRKSLFPGSWNTHVEGHRSVISHDGVVILDEDNVDDEARKKK